MQVSDTSHGMVGATLPHEAPRMVPQTVGETAVRGKRLTPNPTREASEALADAFRHQHYTFPTLSIRQAHILLVLIGEGMHTPVRVDGQLVSADEWIELIKTLVDVRT